MPFKQIVFHWSSGEVVTEIINKLFGLFHEATNSWIAQVVLHFFVVKGDKVEGGEDERNEKISFFLSFLFTLHWACAPKEGLGLMKSSWRKGLASFDELSAVCLFVVLFVLFGLENKKKTYIKDNTTMNTVQVKETFKRRQQTTRKTLQPCDDQK